MTRAEYLLCAVGGLAYIAFSFFLTAGLGFDMLRSDVLGYWNQSLKWHEPFSTWWVPGYSLLIAAVRGVTLNLLPPLIVMSLISGIAYLVSIVAFYRFLVQRGFAAPFFAALMFAFFPLAGLTYAVYPVSDVCAIALFVLSIVAYEKRQWWWFALWAGACLVFHKVMWFFVPPILLTAFILHKESRWILPLACLPVVVWLLAGSIHYQRLSWFMDWGVDNLLTSRTSLPVFDGLLTPLLSGSAAKAMKGLAVGSILAVTLVCIYHCWRRRVFLGLGICFSFLILIAIVNSYEIWAVVRYSKLLLVPVVLLNPGTDVTWSSARARSVAAAILVTFLLSNLVYGVYLVRFFE